jgi:hypothetical protein
MLADLEDRDDSGVLEIGGGLGFRVEALDVGLETAANGIDLSHQIDVKLAGAKGSWLAHGEAPRRRADQVLRTRRASEGSCLLGLELCQSSHRARHCSAMVKAIGHALSSGENIACWISDFSIRFSPWTGERLPQEDSHSVHVRGCGSSAVNQSSCSKLTESASIILTTHRGLRRQTTCSPARAL